MKNEVLARAMTGIDDELIQAAHMQVPKPHKRKQFQLAGAAAGIALIVGSTFILRPSKGIEILVNGNPINGQLIVQDIPAEFSEDIRQSVSNHITVPVEVKTSGKLQIRAVESTLEVYSSKTNQLLCVGQYCKIDESVRINWIIDRPEEDKTYQLQLGGDAGVLRLTYDKENKNWTIQN